MPARRFLLATGVSVYGDWLTTIALLVALYTGSSAGVVAAAAYVVVRFGPRALAPLVISRLTTSLDPRRMFVGAAIIQAALAAVLVVELRLSLIGAVYPIVAVSQFVGSAGRIVHPALLARVATSEAQRPQLNAWYGAIIESSIVVAPALGTVFLTLTSAWTLVAVDGASFVIAATIGLSLPRAGAPARLSPGDDLLQSRAALPADVRLLAVSWVLSGTIESLQMPLLVAAAAQRFAGADRVGILFGLAGVGGVVASLACTRWQPRTPTVNSIMAVSFASCAAIGLIAAAPTLLVAGGVAAVANGLNNVYTTWSFSLLQQRFGESDVVRHTGTLTSALYLGMLVGALIAVVLGGVVVWWALLASTAIVVCAGIAVVGLVGVRPAVASSSVVG